MTTVILDEDEDKLYYKWDNNKYVKITAIFTDPVEINKYLEEHKEESVLYQVDSFYFLANVNDTGGK